MKKAIVFLTALGILTGIISCGGAENKVSVKGRPETGTEHTEKSTATAGCKGDACNFAKLTAKTNGEGRIISITVRNLKSEPVNIQVELTNFLGYSQKPWSRFTLGGNESETATVDPANGFIGAVIKRASVIVE